MTARLSTIGLTLALLAITPVLAIPLLGFDAPVEAADEELLVPTSGAEARADVDAMLVRAYLTARFGF